MAKFEIKFLDVTNFSYIKVEKGTSYSFIGGKDVINIKISGFNSDSSYWINLDKSTAIKFAKTLRTEINKIKDSEKFDKLSNTF